MFLHPDVYKAKAIQLGIELLSTLAMFFLAWLITPFTLLFG